MAGVGLRSRLVRPDSCVQVQCGLRQLRLRLSWQRAVRKDAGQGLGVPGTGFPQAPTACALVLSLDRTDSLGLNCTCI